MAILNKEIIRKNIFSLIDASGLSDTSFSNLLNISSKQVKRLKKGEADFNLDNINKACDFFRQSITEISVERLIPKITFRDILIQTHKDNTEYSALLAKQPSITYAINFELLQNRIFSECKLEIKHINEIFKSKGWSYKSSYISLAIKRNLDKIVCEPHPTKKGTFVYSKKQKT